MRPQRADRELHMTRSQISIVAVAALVFLAGCGPSITVQNSTRIPLRVVVSAGGRSDVLSPSPGESSAAEVDEGPYRATAIPDADWIEYAKLTRKVLNDQLANSDRLSGPQLLDLIQRLKDIAARMQQFEQAAGAGASCGGTVSSDSNGQVTVSQGADGKLVASCR